MRIDENCRRLVSVFCLSAASFACQSREFNAAPLLDTPPSFTSRRVCGLALRASKDRDALLIRVTVPSKRALEKIEGKALDTRLVAFRISSERLADVENSPRMKSDLLTCFDEVNATGDGLYAGTLIFPKNTPRRPMAAGCGNVVRMNHKYLLAVTDPGHKGKYLGMPLRAIDQDSETKLSQSVGSKVCLAGDPFRVKDTVWLAVDKAEIWTHLSKSVPSALSLTNKAESDGAIEDSIREDAKGSWKRIIDTKKDMSLQEKKRWVSDLVVQYDDALIEAKFSRMEREKSDPASLDEDLMSARIHRHPAWSEGVLEACCEALEEIEQEEADLNKKGFFPGLSGKGATGEAVTTQKDGVVELDF